VALLDGPTASTASTSDEKIPITTASATATQTLENSQIQADQEGVSKIQSVSSDNATTGIPLRSVHAVAAHVPFIEDARTKVTSEMENMVLTGLTTLVRGFSFF
jgi:hypothetical protein